jgi:hypothetical protein
MRTKGDKMFEKDEEAEENKFEDSDEFDSNLEELGLTD